MPGNNYPDIFGAESIVSWFGEWPTFHDAEILELYLNRQGFSRLTLNAWLTSKETYEKNGDQYFRKKRGAVITFRFAEILDLQLADFSNQNVISSLSVEQKSGAHRLTLSPCYGINGNIEARGLSVELVPEK
jgi:hypothetical protein